MQWDIFCGCGCAHLYIPMSTVMPSGEAPYMTKIASETHTNRNEGSFFFPFSNLRTNNEISYSKFYSIISLRKLL